MNTNELPAELTEDAKPEEAETWLRKYAVAVGSELNWDTALAGIYVVHRPSEIIDEPGTQRLHAMQPSLKLAVAILTEATRDVRQIFQDAQDKRSGTDTNRHTRKG